MRCLNRKCYHRQTKQTRSRSARMQCRYLGLGTLRCLQRNVTTNEPRPRPHSASPSRIAYVEYVMKGSEPGCVTTPAHCGEGPNGSLLGQTHWEALRLVIAMRIIERYSLRYALPYEKSHTNKREKSILRFQSQALVSTQM
jgi:hypothetical protein